MKHSPCYWKMATSARNIRSVYRKLTLYSQLYHHPELSFPRLQHSCRTFHATACNFAEEHESGGNGEHDLDFYGVQELKDHKFQSESPDPTKAERFQNVNILQFAGTSQPKTNTKVVEESMLYGSIRYDKPTAKRLNGFESKRHEDEEERERIALRQREKKAKKAGKKVRKMVQQSENTLKEEFGNKGHKSDVYSYLEQMYFGDDDRSDRTSLHKESSTGENESFNVRDGEREKQSEHCIKRAKSTKSSSLKGAQVLNSAESSLSYLDEVYFGDSEVVQTKQLDQEQMGFIDTQYFDLNNQNVRNESNREQQNIKPKKESSASDLSFIDEQYFDHRQCEQRTNEAEMPNSRKNTEDSVISTQAEKELSFIDEQYFEYDNLKGFKLNEYKTLPTTKGVKETQIYNVDKTLETRSSTTQLNSDGLLSDSFEKVKPSNTEKTKERKESKPKGQLKVKPMKSSASDANNPQTMCSVDNDVKHVQSDIDKIQTFKSTRTHLEIGNRKVKAKQRKMNIYKNEEDAYNATRKLREEYERKEKIDVYGKANPKQYDSRGFRILSGQTPNFKYVPSIDVIRVLRQNILYDGSDVVAISKPYGLPLQGDSAKDLSIEQLLGDIIPSTTLHRIDTMETGTTGVMLFGKTQEMKDTLTEKLKQGEVCKRFLTITKNVPKLLQGEIDIPIIEGTIEGKHRMTLRPHRTPELAAVMPRQQPGKEAITRYRVLDSKDNSYALVECIPVTSVKHQLRVHLAFGLNCPMLGDHKYSHINKLAPMNLHPIMLQRLKIQQSKVRHLAMHLHCRSIVIPNFLNGRNLFLSAPFPVHFLANMRDLKLKLPPNC